MRLLVRDIDANVIIADLEAESARDLVDRLFTLDAETSPPFSGNAVVEGADATGSYMVYRTYDQFPPVTEDNRMSPAMLELLRVACDPVLFVRGELAKPAKPTRPKVRYEDEPDQEPT